MRRLRHLLWLKHASLILKHQCPWPGLRWLRSMYLRHVSHVSCQTSWPAVSVASGRCGGCGICSGPSMHLVYVKASARGQHCIGCAACTYAMCPIFLPKQAGQLPLKQLVDAEAVASALSKACISSPAEQAPLASMNVDCAICSTTMNPRHASHLSFKTSWPAALVAVGRCGGCGICSGPSTHLFILSYKCPWPVSC